MASPASVLQGWRRQAAYDRVGFWLNAHSYYLQRMEELVVSSTASGTTLADDFDEFESFLQAHSEREERGMFRYLAQTFPSEFAVKMRKLTADHAEYDAHVGAIKRALANGESISALLRARQRELLEHFQTEEEACVPLMLGLTTNQYADYQVMAFGKALQPHQMQETEKFPGVGHSLRGNATESSSVAAVQPVELVTDTTLPTTTVRVRLASGTSISIKANPQSHTVAQLHEHVAWLMSKESTSSQLFELHTAFPPRRSLASEGQSTLQEAGLLNVALVQEVVAAPQEVMAPLVPPVTEPTKSGLHLYRYAVITVMILVLAFFLDWPMH